MKEYKYFMAPTSRDKFGLIRTRVELILTLLKSLEHMLSFPPVKLKDQVPDKLIPMIVHIEKISRIFFVCENKIFSFQFPFSIMERKSDFIIYYKNMENKVSPEIISVYIATFSKFINQKEIDLFDLLTTLDDNFNELCSSLGKEQKEKCFLMCQELICFEPGYLRYDYDEEREQPGHPLNHLDLFYSSNNTFKIGLKKSLCIDEFRNLLSSTSSCSFD